MYGMSYIELKAKRRQYLSTAAGQHELRDWLVALTAQRRILQKYPTRSTHADLELSVLDKKVENIRQPTYKDVLDADIINEGFKVTTEFSYLNQSVTVIVHYSGEVQEKMHYFAANMKLYNVDKVQPTTMTLQQIKIESPPIRGMCYYTWTIDVQTALENEFKNNDKPPTHYARSQPTSDKAGQSSAAPKPRGIGDNMRELNEELKFQQWQVCIDDAWRSLRLELA